MDIERILIGPIRFLVLLAFCGWIWSQFRSGASLLSKRLGRTISFRTNRPPMVVLQVILAFAEEAGYKVEAVDEPAGCVVLSDKMSLRKWSGGFFYSIILTLKGEGETKVVVGIKSRFIQIGPFVGREHRRCVNGIKARLRADKDVGTD